MLLNRKPMGATVRRGLPRLFHFTLPGFHFTCTRVRCVVAQMCLTHLGKPHQKQRQAKAKGDVFQLAGAPLHPKAKAMSFQTCSGRMAALCS